MLSFYIMVFMAASKILLTLNLDGKGKIIENSTYYVLIIFFPIIGLPMARLFIIRNGRNKHKAIQTFADIIEEPPSFFYKDLKDAFSVWNNEALLKVYI